MNTEIKDKWTAALRSGEYKQGTGMLRDIDDTYCCLGVLCDLYQKETGIGTWNKNIYNQREYYAFVSVNNQSSNVLPKEVIDWAELMSDNPFIPSKGNGIAAINDKGVSFEKIAEIIEE